MFRHGVLGVLASSCILELGTLQLPICEAMGTRTGVGVYFASPTSHSNAVWETDVRSSSFQFFTM